jgi:integration host factor subunit alpha
MTTINKKSLTTAIVAQGLLSPADAAYLVDAFFAKIANFLINGQDVKISGFGNFILRHKKARMGLNPVTREEVPIAARTVVVFKAGKKLKALL